MNRIEYIRDDLKKKFSRLAHNDNIELSAEWFPPSFSEENVIANWISEDLKKVMRIQESCEDEILQFDSFIAKAGEDDRYDDLFIQAVAVNEKAELIYDLYKLWFAENTSTAEMSEILEKVERKLNLNQDIVLYNLQHGTVNLPATL